MKESQEAEGKKVVSGGVISYQLPVENAYDRISI
jgi:hypothetical protein